MTAHLVEKRFKEMYKIICNGIDTVSDRVEISIKEVAYPKKSLPDIFSIQKYLKDFYEMNGIIKPEKKIVRLRKIDEKIKECCKDCHYNPNDSGCIAGDKEETKTEKLLTDICYDENIIFELVK